MCCGYVGTQYSYGVYLSIVDKLSKHGMVYARVMTYASLYVCVRACVLFIYIILTATSVVEIRKPKIERFAKL